MCIPSVVRCHLLFFICKYKRMEELSLVVNILVNTLMLLTTCRHSPQFLTWLTHLTFIWTSWRRFCYEPHFTGDEKCMVIGIERLGSLPMRVTVRDKAGLRPKQTGCRACVLHHYSLLPFWKFISIISRRKVTLTFEKKSFHVTVRISVLGQCVWGSFSQVRWDRTKVEKYYPKEHFP